MTIQQSWQGHLLNIVDQFLETVVLVDDQAFEQVTHLQGDEWINDESWDSLPGRGVHSNLVSPEVADTDDLDAKAVMDAFADRGLICTILSPTSSKSVDEPFLKVARKADMLVLDWVFQNDNGKLAIGLIEKLLNEDGAASQRRLRAIAIYTGQSNLHSVAVQVRQTLEGFYSDCTLRVEDDDLTMTKGPVRIGVFAKSGILSLPDHLESRKLAPDQLPNRLCSEFAKLADGLVTTVALAAIASLRHDTHRILSSLDSSLDAAYLGHRSALVDPSDAEAHAVSMVISEIRSVIEDHQSGEKLSSDALRGWLNDVAQSDIRFGHLMGEGQPELSKDQMAEILDKGLGSSEVITSLSPGGYSKNKAEKWSRIATKLFARTSELASNSDSSFLYRMKLRTVYSHPTRVLRLGVIVQLAENYLLCVQPACDSIRLTLDSARSYPFIKLSLAQSQSETHFVVPGGSGSWISLEFKPSPFNIVTYEFKPSSHLTVETVISEGKYIFIGEKSKRFEWIGELKQDFAQKAAVDLAHQFSRVAVDEVESLRRLHRA